MFDKGPDVEGGDDAVSPAAVEADRLSGLLDEIATIEATVAGLQAEQVLRVAEFVEGMRVLTSRCDSAGWSDESQRLAAMQIAAAKRLSVGAAEHYLVDAVRLATALPAVLGVLEAGLTTLSAVRAVCAETINLQPESLPIADEILADDLLDTTPSRARTVARTRIFEIDPEAAHASAVAARDDRFVCVSPSIGVGMGCLTAIVPAEQAMAFLERLRCYAKTRHAAGDTRSLSQIMADTLVERVTGQTTADQVPVTVGLVMSDTTLLGLDDRPGQLTGFGPVPAAVARWLTAHDSTWVRRLYTDPVDATVAVVDTGRRRFDGALRELVVTRDQHCRGPGCPATIRDIDHTIPVTDAGETTAGNGRGYCRRCHRAKHHPQVQVGTPTRHIGPAVIGHQAYTRWAMPAGPVLATIAPPALGIGSTTRQISRSRRHLLHNTTGRPGLSPRDQPSLPEQRNPLTPVC
jgi:hypothetical protein